MREVHLGEGLGAGRVGPARKGDAPGVLAVFTVEEDAHAREADRLAHVDDDVLGEGRVDRREPADRGILAHKVLDPRVVVVLRAEVDHPRAVLGDAEVAGKQSARAMIFA